MPPKRPEPVSIHQPIPRGPLTNKPTKPLPKMAHRESQDPQNKAQFPFLVKTTITVLVNNPAGIQEKKVLPAYFQLDAAAAEMPWYVLRNYLVVNFLREKLGPQGEKWQKVYEIKIDKMINRTAPEDVEGIPLRILTWDQLAQYVKRWQYPIQVKDFHSVEYARQMIELWEQDPKGYELQYGNYMAEKVGMYPALEKFRKEPKLAANPALEEEFESLHKAPGAVEVPKPAPAKAAEVAENQLSKEEQTALNSDSGPSEPGTGDGVESAPEPVAAPADDPFAGV